MNIVDLGENDIDPTSYQGMVDDWAIDCFGKSVARNQEERTHRFLEEALEMAQASGCTQADAHRLVDYVYGRETGDPAQEAGAVMLTLAALCNAIGLDMEDCAQKELSRVWDKLDAIRAKQAAKPENSPLPE